MQPTVNIALRVLREAGEELTQAVERFDFADASELEISKFIAECCIGTEKKLIFSLRKHFPEHSFQGRETGFHERNPDTDTVWFINPIEGLENFRNGLPLYSMVLVCQINGKVEHAIVFNPASGEEFSASRGRGSEYNNRRTRTGERLKIEQAMVGLKYPGLAQNERNERLRTRIANFSNQVRGVRVLGNDAITMAYAAAGRLDAVWLSEVDSINLMAGSLLMKEAGCLICDFAGGNDMDKQGDVVAANPKLMKTIIQVSL